MNLQRTFQLFMMPILWLSIFSCCSKTDTGTPITQKDTTSISKNTTFGFITRNGDKLMNGTSEFRFVGMNTPNITIVEDKSFSQGNWHRVDSFEVKDAFRTILQMGGTVTRTYSFSINGGVTNPAASSMSHVMSLGSYNEDLFKDFDMVLKYANQYQVRLVVPFIDNWKWWGGTAQFAAFEGKTQAQFCTDAAVIKDFKDFISYILNRTNTLTGVKYKDDPAILAWETGNELGIENANSDASLLDKWTNDIAAYIKTIDKNHLVQDGKDCYRYGLSNDQLNSTSIDIITDHYYWGDYVAACNKSRTACQGKKVFYVGEYNSADPTVNDNMLNAIRSNGSSGALMWSLRTHTKDGGFYYHEDPTNAATPCYRWPGFSSASATNEATKMDQIRMYAYIIQGITTIPTVPAPLSPYLIVGSSPNALRWQGSTGAVSYIVERATDPNGTWSVISNSATEDAIPYTPFRDGTAQAGTNYYYRVKAQNSTGISAASNVIGPLTI